MISVLPKTECICSKDVIGDGKVAWEKK